MTLSERVWLPMSPTRLYHYWEKEFAAYPERLRAEVISPVQNKIGAYLTNRPLRNILGQSSSTIHFRNIIDHGAIFIVNLAKGRLGEEAANLLGSFVVSGLQQADPEVLQMREINDLLGKLKSLPGAAHRSCGQPTTRARNLIDNANGKLPPEAGQLS